MDVSHPRYVLEQFAVSDFVQWYRENQLNLNPDFQRRSIWSLDAKSYLIDTILLGYSMPKIYLRTHVDTKTLATIRDVVDGQQRLRAILSFTNNEFALNRRSEGFRGFRYRDLNDEQQQTYLSYPIAVHRLLNANDSEVLQIFSRLNSYTIPLNSAEKRHALYQTELKWFVHGLANDFRDFLTRFRILTTNSMLRMTDDAFFAGLVDVLVTGIGDGGEAALNALYAAYKEEFPELERVRAIVGEGVTWINDNLHPVLDRSPLSRPYQVQMIFAAYVYQRHGLPLGRMEADEMPPRLGVDEIGRVLDRLEILAQALSTEDTRGPYGAFIRASSEQTTRFSTRKVRFLTFSRAISSRPE